MSVLSAPVADQLVEERPPADRSRDQVGCTAATLIARVDLLADHCPLGGQVVALGDRDFTGVAARRALDLEVDVVDVDERVLAAASALAPAAGRWFADLRLGLPRALQGVADVVFTDPPYSPEGLRTFLAAAIQALAPDRPGIVLLAFGAGGHRPDLVNRGQEEIVGLGLAIVDLHRGFNRYEHAPALADRSDLYVCVPTGASRRAAPRAVEKLPATIYSQGASAVNATPAQESAGTSMGELRRLFRDPAPLHERRQYELGPHLSHLSPRVLFASNASVTEVRAAAPLQREQALLMERRFAIDQRRSAAGTWVITAQRLPSPEAPTSVAVRYLLDHGFAAVPNAAAEAVIAGREVGPGTPLTRREARQRVAPILDQRYRRGQRLLDLSWADLSALVDTLVRLI